MKLLVIGGAGFLGSYVTDVFVKRGHEVIVLDDLSSCWLDEEADVPTPKFKNASAVYLNDVNAAISADPEVVVVCSLRHPLERDRELYFTAFDGFVLQTVRIVSDSMRARSKLRRVVVTSTMNAFTIDRKKVTPNVHLIRSLRELLTYWHRPPNFEMYFAHLPELRGDRRLPEVGDPGEDAVPVEDAADFVVKLAASAKHRLTVDYYFGDRISYDF